MKGQAQKWIIQWKGLLPSNKAVRGSLKFSSKEAAFDKLKTLPESFKYKVKTTTREYR